MSLYKKNKSGQLFLISAFLLMSSLLFIYSLETENYYIVNFSESIILENILYETCNVGYNSNGSFIESRFTSFQNYVNSDCQNNYYNCDLQITKITSAPTNLSLLNYGHFNFTLSFDNKNLNYSNKFTC